MLLRYIYYFFLISVLASCASQIPPTGGAKDVTPPTVLHENPQNLSVNFKSKKITITFDEYIQLNDANNQIFFSPVLTGKVEYRLKGKSLVITLPDSLKSNTTYTVNFGSAIKDNNEGNIMLNYQYVFSTGATIDSFRIQGNVVNALDGKSKPNLLVMLYSDLTDSAVARQRPDYNARTDSFGNFVLSHLRGNTYRLLAIDDQNFDFMYSQQGEPVAFIDTPISVHDTLQYFKFLLFRPEAEKQSVLGTFSRQQGRASFAFARRTKNLVISPVNDSLKSFVELNTTRDTASVWVNDMKSDSIEFKLHDEDFSDTIKVRMKAAEAKQKTVSASATKLGIGITSFGKGGGPVRKGDPLLLYFNAPIVAMNEKEKIFLRDDSMKKDYEVKPVLFQDTASGKQRAQIDFKFVEGLKYTLVIPDSVFKDLGGTWNDSVQIPFNIFSEEDLGNLNLKISFTDSTATIPYYFEFRSKEGVLIARQRLHAKSKTISFSSLPPGDYTLKVVEDRNNNFIWDTGDYWKHLQPERIFFYKGNITLRANWDIDVQMKVDNKQ